MTDDLLTVDELGDEYRIPVSTLRTWRSLDRGPKSFRIGRRVLYRRAEVEKWIAEQERTTARGGVE